VGRIVAMAGVADADVLDIGCGTGGAASHFRDRTSARSVTGVDVESFVVDAQPRPWERGQHERIASWSLSQDRCQLLTTRSMSCSVKARSSTFGIGALYAEAHRVLRSGGRLCVGDWLKTAKVTTSIRSWRALLPTHTKSSTCKLSELSALVSSVGSQMLKSVDATGTPRRRTSLPACGDRCATASSRFDPDFYTVGAIWERIVASTQQGVLRPGHVEFLKALTWTAADQNCRSAARPEARR
jgi:SAM-dependent methyltransferase